MLFSVLITLTLIAGSIETKSDRPGLFAPLSPKGDVIFGQEIISDSLTVYVFLLDECVISQFYTPQLIEFYNTYHNKKVGFIGYFPNFSSKPDQIESFGKKYLLPFPLKQDYYKDWSKKFGMTVTPEVAVWDHRKERLIYRGRIDDSYVRVGKRKLHPQHQDLKDIIDGWLAGEVPDMTVITQAIGCYINFNSPMEKDARRQMPDARKE